MNPALLPTNRPAQAEPAPLVIPLRLEHGLATYARARRRVLRPLRRGALDVIVKLDCERPAAWIELLRFCSRLYRHNKGVLLIVARDSAPLLCGGLLCFDDEGQARRMVDLVRADRRRREVARRLAP